MISSSKTVQSASEGDKNPRHQQTQELDSHFLGSRGNPAQEAPKILTQGQIY
jgi:hypothetical protein